VGDKLLLVSLLPILFFLAWQFLQDDSDDDETSGEELAHSAGSDTAEHDPLMHGDPLMMHHRETSERHGWQKELSDTHEEQCTDKHADSTHMVESL
jgi:hypothetical protein